MKPKFLICFCITIAAAGNRLGLFMSHHTGEEFSNEKFLSKSTLSLQEEMERQAKLETMERICTAKTCSKCAKYVTVKSKSIAYNYCSIILDTPQCCSTQHLLSGF